MPYLISIVSILIEEELGYHFGFIHSYDCRTVKVELVEYEATAEGLIQSWNERFADADVHPLLEELCVKEGVYSA